MLMETEWTCYVAYLPVAVVVFLLLPPGLASGAERADGVDDRVEVEGRQVRVFRLNKNRRAPEHKQEQMRCHEISQQPTRLPQKRTHPFMNEEPESKR